MIKIRVEIVDNHSPYKGNWEPVDEIFAMAHNGLPADIEFRNFDAFRWKDL
jgi:hypothetical protein